MENALNSVLITGGSGMIGSCISFGVKPSSKELNILNQKSIMAAIKRYDPRVILHLAALTNLQECEKDPKKAYEVNMIGTYNVAKACRELNLRMVYFSTCAIFNGKKKSGYIETDIPGPLNVYGRTKLIGELIIKDLVKHSLIIRSGWLFGGSLRKNKKFIKTCIENAMEKNEIKATANRFGSPTYLLDLIITTERLMNESKTGTYHIVNKGKASYYQIAKEIVRVGNFSSLVQPIKAEEIEPAYLLRGKLEVLSSKKITLRPWKERMKEYIKFFKKDF